jgi:hypothetical protein
MGIACDRFGGWNFKPTHHGHSTTVTIKAGLSGQPRLQLHATERQHREQPTRSQASYPWAPEKEDKDTGSRGLGSTWGGDGPRGRVGQGRWCPEEQPAVGHHQNCSVRVDACPSGANPNDSPPPDVKSLRYCTHNSCKHLGGHRPPEPTTGRLLQHSTCCSSEWRQPSARLTARPPSSHTVPSCWSLRPEHRPMAVLTAGLVPCPTSDHLPSCGAEWEAWTGRDYGSRAPAPAPAPTPTRLPYIQRQCAYPL